MKTQVTIGIGIDCGTSGVRVSALNSQGELLAHAQTKLSEQTPSAWWQAVCKTMNILAPQLHLTLSHRHSVIEQCAISFDGTSSTIFLTNQQGIVLSDVRMYYHSHPAEAQVLKAVLAKESGAQGASSSLAKVLALSAQFADQPVWRVCHQADWIGQQLTGVVGVSDENNVLKLGYDVQQSCWPRDVITLLPENSLPKVLPPATPFSALLPELAQLWRLPTNTQIATGTTDSIAAFLATKAHHLGDAVISLGSTLAFKLLCDQPYYHLESGIYSHRLWDQWLVGGASNAGGAVLLEYFSVEEMTALSQRMRGLALLDLDYYPLPSTAKGERFPMANPNQRSKLTPKPQSDTHFLQAMLEGLVSIEQQGWKKLEVISGQAIKRLFACGGGTKNSAWAGLRNQQLPYLTAIPFSQEAAVGSAILALKSLGVELT